MKSNSVIKKNISDKIDIAGWICVIILFCLNSIIIFKGTWNFIHSDGATAILFALEQIEQGKMYPSGWCNGTGVWNIGLQTLIIPFLKICDSWLNARALAVILQMFIAIVVLYGFKHYGIIKKRAWTVILFMMLPISEVITEHWYFQATYMTLTIFLMLLILSTYALMYEKGRGKIIPTLVMVALLVIKIGSSYSMILVFVAPMLGALIFDALFRTYHKEKERKALYVYVLPIIIIVVGTIGGLIYNKYIAMALNTKSSGISYAFITHKELWESLGNFVQNILRVYGVLDKNAALLSLAGINKVLAVVYFGFVFVYIPICLIRNFEKLKRDSQRIFLVFSMLSSAATIYLTIIAAMPQSRYLLWVYFFTIVWLGIWIDNFNEIQYEYEKEIRIVFIAFIIVLFGGAYMYYLTYDYEENPDVLGVNNTYRDYKVDYDLLNYLEENNYKFGYSTYWSSYSYMVASSGEVQMAAAAYDWSGPYYWLTSKKWYESDVYDGECFVLLRWQQLEELPEQYTEKAIGQEEYNGHIILKYNSVEEIHEIWDALSPGWR